MHKYVRTMGSSVVEASVISLIDVVPAFAALIFFRTGLIAALGLILLVESSGLLLLGGALSFTGQEGFRRLTSLLAKVDLKTSEREDKKNEMKAALYVLTGVILFVESSVLAVLTA